VPGDILRAVLSADRPADDTDYSRVIRGAGGG